MVSRVIKSYIASEKYLHVRVLFSKEAIMRYYPRYFSTKMNM